MENAHFHIRPGRCTRDALDCKIVECLAALPILPHHDDSGEETIREDFHTTRAARGELSLVTHFNYSNLIEQF